MKSKRRIEILDIAKCIAIFMVVWGHTFTNSELLGNPPLIAKVLYSTHMPLFFFLSGMSISLKPLSGLSEWRIFLKKNVLTVAIPYVIWSLVYSKFSYTNLMWILYGSWEALGKVETVTSLWFLSCLFVAKIISQIIVNLTARLNNKNNSLYIIVGIILFAIGYFMVHPAIGYPWCFDIALQAAGCMFMGFALKKAILELSVQKGPLLVCLSVVITIIFGVLVVVNKDVLGVTMMCKNSYPNALISFILAILGSFNVLILSMILKRTADEWLPKLDFSSLSYIGQHTLGILLLHKPFLQEIVMPLLTKYLYAICPDMIIRLLATFISMFVSLWLCRFIEYYIPELVGIFSKDKLLSDKDN